MLSSVDDSADRKILQPPLTRLVSGHAGPWQWSNSVIDNPTACLQPRPDRSTANTVPRGVTKMVFAPPKVSMLDAAPKERTGA